MTSKKTRKKKGPVKRKISPHWFVLFFVAVLLLAILVVKPFISSILIASVLAYVLYPLYRGIHKKVKSKGLSAGIVIVLLILVLAAPLVFVTAHVAEESYDLYKKVKEVYTDGETGTFCHDNTGLICRGYNAITAFAEEQGMSLGGYVATASSNILAGLISSITGFLLNLPSFIFHIFITLFIIFYMLIDSERMVNGLKNALPLKEEHKESIFSQFNDMIHATIYGAIVMAIIQGMLALIAFFIFNAPSPIILGILTVVFAFVPFIGTAIVWVPASVTMIISGLTAADNGLLMRGIGLFMVGALIISTIDNILRPKIVGDRARIHPLIILLGVFGGIGFFGLAGVIIGPLILTLFISALKIYEQEKEHIIT